MVVNPFFATNRSIKKYYYIEESLVNATYEKDVQDDNLSQCQLYKELLCTEVGGSPIQALNNQAYISDDSLKIRWNGSQKEITITLKAILKSSTGIFVNELSISTNLTIIDPCPIYNELSMVIDGDIFISNAIRAAKVSKQMPIISDLLT